MTPKKIWKKIFAVFFFPLLGFGQMTEHPFDYDLHLFSLPGTNQRTMICFHGYGDNYQIAHALKSLCSLEAMLVSFNFPEYDIKKGRQYDPKTASFGTVDELLPALYVLKKTIVDQDLEFIDLYGFSAGGGALINMIGILNTSTHDEMLAKIGIGRLEKERLLSAIQNGLIILDVPLKSVEEIMDLRGSTEELKILAKKYEEHHFRPIDSLQKLSRLTLNILLYFDKNDEIISNRDDCLFIERLQISQPNTQIIMADEGGHMGLHFSLWRAYTQRIEQPGYPSE